MEEWLGRKLRVIRAERGLSLREAARRAGVVKETISDIERGHSHPYDVTLAKLARAYHVPLEELLEEPEETRPAPKAEAPQLTVERFADYGIHPTGMEIATLNAKLRAFVELAQTGAQMTTITIPHVEGAEETGVDMSRVDMLISFAAMAGILTEQDQAVILNGVARELVAGRP
jgi:transcriptional regulator with XRE-family HTH domain